MKKISAFLLVLCTGLTFGQGPANDFCQGAIALPGPGIFAGTTVGSSASLFGTGTCGLAGWDVWYTYAAAGTGNKLIASTCPPGSSAFSTGVDIFTGTCFTAVTAGCSTAFCNLTPSITGGRAIVNSTVAGTVYMIRVKGLANGQTGTFNLYVDEIPASQSNGTCATPNTVFDGINTAKSNFGEPAALDVGFTACASAGKDVFFSYLATATGGTLVRTCFLTPAAVPALNIRDSVLAVYNSCAGGPPLACNDNGCGGTIGTGSNLSSVTFQSTAGFTYIIQVCGAGSGAAAAEGNFDLEVIPPPPNDDCAGAVVVNYGPNGPFTNLAANDSVGYAGSCSTGYKDLFYQYTPSCGAPTTISTGCFGFDTVLSVWSACGGTELACDDNSTACSPSDSVTVNMTAGTTYFIRVASSFPGTTGSYNVDISAGFGLNWDSPSGPGSIRFSLCNGPPNGSYYLFLTFFVGGFPFGWFYGIDMTLQEISAEINFGFPFSAALNGAGGFTSPNFTGVPPGLAVYATAFALPAGSSSVSANSGAKSYVVP